MEPTSLMLGIVIGVVMSMVVDAVSAVVIMRSQRLRMVLRHLVNAPTLRGAFARGADFSASTPVAAGAAIMGASFASALSDDESDDSDDEDNDEEEEEDNSDDEDEDNDDSDDDRDVH